MSENNKHVLLLGIRAKVDYNNWQKCQNELDSFGITLLDLFGGKNSKVVVFDGRCLAQEVFQKFLKSSRALSELVDFREQKVMPLTFGEVWQEALKWAPHLRHV